MEWNLTHSGEILESLIVTHCLNLVRISWRLASLLQTIHREVSAIMYAYLQVYASENNGRFVRHKNQRDALIQFTYMLVDA